MARYVNAQIEQGSFPGGRLASPEAFASMQSLQIQTGEGHFGRAAYGYGLGIAPGFLGHTLVSHGGSISVPRPTWPSFDLKLGVVMMGNGPGMAYGRIAETVLALLMGLDPDEALPANRIRARMDLLVGATRRTGSSRP